MLKRTTFNQIRKGGEKKYVLFGSGNIAKKTIRKLGTSNILFIADNSKNLQGSSFSGINIQSPDKISSEHFVIICSTAIREISSQLMVFGLSENENFVISPILNDLLAINDLEQLNRVFYFTSGSIPDEAPQSGGGLYKCTLDGLSTQIEKVYSGPCYGAVRVGDELYFIDTDKGIFARRNDEEILHKCELPQGSRAHGISYNDQTQNFYVSCSYLDAILEIDSTNLWIKRQFNISSKIDSAGEPMHHCNDNWSIGNSLFVSMFSSTGQWKLDVFNGCIAEFDLLTGERLQDLRDDLYMPHNIMVFDGSIHVLDSLPGHLRFNNLSIQGTFPAFSRGLAYNKGLYFIGQSKNRNYSKVLGLSNNVSIDCGVIAFNPELKVSRFFQFPFTIGEIHSIVF